MQYRATNLPPPEWQLYANTPPFPKSIVEYFALYQPYWLTWWLWVNCLIIVEWMLSFWAHIKSDICRSGYRCQNGPTSGISAQLTIIPRVYYQNPLEGAPQQPSRWCMCCQEWRWSMHAPAIFDWASWCCAAYFAPQTAAMKMIRRGG